MGIQIIKNQADFLSMGIMLINEFSHKICPVNFGTLLSGFRRALAISWFKSYENVRGPISLILCIIPERLPRLGWQRGTDFTNQLGRHCIHTHLRTLGIIIRRDLSGSGLLTIVCKRFLIRELEDRFESQSRASRSGIALGVSPSGVSPQVVDHRLESATIPRPIAIAKGAKQLREGVGGGH